MKRNHESGFMLVGTILAIVVLAVVGLSLTSLAVYSLDTSSHERDNQSAYYIAEAGLTYLVNDLEQKTQTIYDDEAVKTKDDFYNKIEELDYILGETTYDQFEKVNDIQPHAQLKVKRLDKVIPEPEEVYERYQLTSTGYLGDESRMVTQVVQIAWQEKYEETGGAYELPPFVVFTNGNFRMGSGKIVGDIGSLSEAPNSMYFKNAGGVHEGIIYVLDREKNIVKIEEYSSIKSDIDQFEQSYVIPSLPPFPEFPTYACPENKTIFHGSNSYKVINNCNLRIDNGVVNNTNYTLVMNENMKFDKMIFREDIKLRIDVQNEDREIVVDHLDITNGHIELLGTGKLTIYVKDEITLGAASKVNNNGDVSRLNIYLKGTGNPNNGKFLRISGGQSIYGSLYAEDADIELTGGGAFVGNLFTGGKNFKISGGFESVAQLFFAPNAFVDMRTGGNSSLPFRGKIIADRFEIDDGWHVYMEDIHLSDGPISPAALGLDYGEGGGSGGGSGGGPGSVETGNKPSFTKSSVREIKQ